MITSISSTNNLEFVLDANPTFLDTFFKLLDTSVLRKVNTLCNFDHICHFLLFLLEDKPVLVYPYIAGFNILYNFIPYLSYRKVYDFYFSILSPGIPELRAGSELWEKYMRYCSVTYFLCEVSELMFNATPLPSEKFLSKYRPIAMPELSRAQPDMFGPKSPSKKKDSRSISPVAIDLAETKNKVKIDIDRIMHIIHKRRSSVANSPVNMLKQYTLKKKGSFDLKKEISISLVQELDLEKETNKMKAANDIKIDLSIPSADNLENDNARSQLELVPIRIPNNLQPRRSYKVPSIMRSPAKEKINSRKGPKIRKKNTITSARSAAKKKLFSKKNPIGILPKVTVSTTVSRRTQNSFSVKARRTGILRGTIMSQISKNYHSFSVARKF